jgi:hypothetical protein
LGMARLERGRRPESRRNGNDNRVGRREASVRWDADVILILMFCCTVWEQLCGGGGASTSSAFVRC